MLGCVGEMRKCKLKHGTRLLLVTLVVIRTACRFTLLGVTDKSS